MLTRTRARSIQFSLIVVVVWTNLTRMFVIIEKNLNRGDVGMGRTSGFLGKDTLGGGGLGPS